VDDKPRDKTQSNEQDVLPPVLNPSEDIDKYNRRLPHWQQGKATQFVTWRLGDALPQAKLDQWKQKKDSWVSLHPKPWDHQTEDEYYMLFEDRLEKYLDSGYGSCLLRNEQPRQIVANALMHFDEKRYNLWAFVIMPNHVHALFSIYKPYVLKQITHSWKSFTAKAINRQLGKSGSVWQEESWDRLIRNEEHFFRCLSYIQGNPEKARLSPNEYTQYARNYDTTWWARCPPSHL